MRFLDKVERRLGWLAIPNLIMYIVAGRGIAYMLAMSNPAYPAYLILDPEAVRRGEVWRLVTYLFTPPGGGLFFALIELYFTYLVGKALETVWGAFHFTLYYLVGTIAIALVALFITNSYATPSYLNLSLFLAFATIFPDFTVLLFFILPVKVKYLGLIAAAWLSYVFWMSGFSEKIAITVAFSNYLLFFWPEIILLARRNLSMLTGGRAGRARITVIPMPQPKSIHKCVACGMTEREDPQMDFRVCSCEKCGPDGKEYCMPHLEEHRKETAEA